MGNPHSSRWPRGYQKKTCVGECRRLSPREAPHAGISTVTTSMPRGGGLRRWCLCPICGKRKGDLFQRAGSDALAGALSGAVADAWACRECHGLTYRARQRRRVRVIKMEEYPPFSEWTTRHPLAKAWWNYQLQTSTLRKEDAERFNKELTELLFNEYEAAFARLVKAGRVR